jgi:GT2 family glycosyltransferase
MTAPLGLAVVAYQDPESLEALLSSAVGFDEVTVANVSADPAVAEVAAAHGATAIPIHGNPGFAAAVNILSRACHSQWLLVTNDDVLLHERCATACRLAQGREPVVVPALHDPGGNRQRSLRAIPSPFRFLLEWVLLPDKGPRFLPVTKWQVPVERSRVPAATAAALMVDRSLLVERPMPEEFVMYWEELDWFWRLRDEGVPVAVDPSIVITRSDGRDERGEAKWERMGGNVVRLGRRRWGLLGALLYFALCCGWLARLVVTDAAAKDRSSRWRARRRALRGSWAVLRGAT